MIKRALAAVAIAVLAIASGCKTYDPKPLDPRRELAAIASFNFAAFRVEHMQPGELPPGDDGSTAPVVSSSSAFDISDGLSEAEVVGLALTINPAIRAKRYGSTEARSHLVTAGLWPNPVFAIAWQWGVAGGPSVNGDAAWLLEVIRVWERGARLDAAKAAVGEAEADIVAAEWRLVAEVRSALWSTLVAERLLTMLDEEVALRRRALEVVRKGKELGEARELDLALAELEVAELGRDRRRAETELETARRDLNRTIGVPPDTILPLTERAKPLTFVVYDEPRGDDIDDRLVSHRFELRAREFAYARSEHELRLAIYRQYPPLGVGPSFSRQPERTYYVGPAFLIELPIFNQNQGEIAESEAARERVRLEYIALLQALRAEAHEALGLLRRAKLEVDAQEKEVLPVIDRSQKLLEEGFRLGEVKLPDLIAAQRRALQARREYVTSLTRYQQAVIRLEVAMGTSLARK